AASLSRRHLRPDQLQLVPRAPAARQRGAGAARDAACARAARLRLAVRGGQREPLLLAPPAARRALLRRALGGAGTRRRRPDRGPPAPRALARGGVYAAAGVPP